MSKKRIEKNLRTALLQDGPMAMDLFEYELQAHIAEYLLSRHADHDAFLFAVTENSGDVAMLLIDETNSLHINEAARAMLKQLWPGEAYEHNMRILIPQMAKQLNDGYLYYAGVKVEQGPRLAKFR